MISYEVIEAADESSRGRAIDYSTLESRCAHLGWFVAERMAIWARREAGLSRPWTIDPILATRHFTNVHRELDPGTRYVHERLAGLGRADAIWLAVAYRVINRRATFEEYGDTPPTRVDRRDWLAYLDDRHARRLPVCTARHLTPNRHLRVELLERAAHVDVPHDSEDAFEALRALPGIGWFLAGQVHSDLVEAGFVEHDLLFARVADGSAFGVGVVAGLRRFNEYLHVRRGRVAEGRPHQFRVRSRDLNVRFSDWIRWLVVAQHDWLPLDRIRWQGRDLDAKTVEHALCEWVRYGVIHARREDGR